MRAARKQQRLHPPQQARSRATLERVLGATQELLAEKRFEETTVVEIVRRAGSSVGSFYARFPDKRSLLARLDRDLFEKGRVQWDALLDPRRWEGRRAPGLEEPRLCASPRGARSRLPVRPEFAFRPWSPPSE